MVVIDNSADKSSEIIKRLLGQLSSLKGDSAAKHAKDAPSGAKDSSKGSTLTYELFYKPEYSKLQQAQQVGFVHAHNSVRSLNLRLSNGDRS